MDLGIEVARVLRPMAHPCYALATLAGWVPDVQHHYSQALLHLAVCLVTQQVDPNWHLWRHLP